MQKLSAITRNGLPLGVCLNIGVSTIFALVAVFLIYQVKVQMRGQAMVEAETKAHLILERNLATHTYFSHMLKPHVFSLTEASLSPDYFDPVWMSSTYAVREIDKFFKKLTDQDYYYKECAVNTRSPENEADAYEKAFLEALNKDPELMTWFGIRELDGMSYYVTMRRGEVMESSCLRCHNTPAEAPAKLVEAYGPDRSFGRNSGEVISAISIRVPLSVALANADNFAGQLSWILSGALLCLFAGQFFIYRLFVGNSLKALHDQARLIAEDDEHLGDKIPLPYARELNVTVRAFNRMSSKLKNIIDYLEQIVEERTRDLKTSNEQLRKQIQERRQAEAEKELLIRDLQNALSEIKNLQGIIPICCYCKQIRDDKGYWTQVEAYIQDHTDALFSHSICPKCKARVYEEEGLG